MADSQINADFANQIADQVAKLDHKPRMQVLHFAKTLARTAPPGEPGTQLLPLIGSIPLDDLNEMHTAIQNGCEKVDADGW
jgi:hypothetical protein